jgi:hypothetical protein
MNLNKELLPKNKLLIIGGKSKTHPQPIVEIYVFDASVRFNECIFLKHYDQIYTIFYEVVEKIYSEVGISCS